jgi:hypothetical protein
MFVVISPFSFVFELSTMGGRRSKLPNWNISSLWQNPFFKNKNKTIWLCNVFLTPFSLFV